MSADAIAQMLTAPMSAYLPTSGVRLFNVSIDGTVSLANRHVPVPFECHTCRIDAVDLRNATLASLISIRSSHVVESLQMPDSSIAEAFEIRETSFGGPIILDGARIDGRLILRDVDPEFFTATAATLRRGATISGIVTEGGISISGLETQSGDLELVVSSAAFLTAMDMRIGGSLRIGQVAGSSSEDGPGEGQIAGSIRLDRTRVDGQLNIANLSASGIIGADSNVTGQLSVNQVRTPSEINFARSTFAGDIVVRNSTLESMSLLDSSVAISLLFDEVSWNNYEDSYLDLRFASIGNFWLTGLEEELPNSLRLDQLVLSGWGRPSPDLVGSDWIIEQLVGRDSGYNSTVFNALADSLDQNGYSRVAADVRYAERSAYKGLSSHSWSHVALLQSYDSLMGFGYKPWRLLLWFLGLFIIGVGLLRGTGKSWFVAFAFSLACALPMVRLPALDVGEDWVIEPTRGVASWLIIQSLFGWLLTAAALVWLATLAVAS